jgi:ferritin-like metal-binding protein YciE
MRDSAALCAIAVADCTFPSGRRANGFAVIARDYAVLLSESVRKLALRARARYLRRNEATEIIKEDADEEVRDAGLISAAQRVEHYEIAGYGCARTYAELLGDTKGAQLLRTTLEEETVTDKKLTELAKTMINLKAVK